MVLETPRGRSGSTNKFGDLNSPGVPLVERPCPKMESGKLRTIPLPGQRQRQQGRVTPGFPGADIRLVSPARRSHYRGSHVDFPIYDMAGRGQNGC